MLSEAYLKKEVPLVYSSGSGWKVKVGKLLVKSRETEGGAAVFQWRGISRTDQKWLEPFTCEKLCQNSSLKRVWVV